MSGVSNLRAMFENKDTSTSPPDRGRSPAESIGAVSNGTSPRPLSKVRTSFVTVERSGQLGSQLGLKRDTSGEPSMSKRRTSFSIDEKDDPKGTAERKQTIATEYEARKNSTVTEETIPEVAVETPGLEDEKRLGGGKERGREPVRPKVEAKQPVPASGPSNSATNGTGKPAVVKQSEKASTSKVTSRPAPISTSRTAAAPKPSPKKTPVPRTPTTPKIQKKDKSPERKPEKKTSRVSLAQSQSSKPSAKPTTSMEPGSASKTRIGASPPQTGFHKPKPRSPTRPVKLPASLTQHTASSGLKTSTSAPAQPAAVRRSLSRASGNSQPTNSLQAHVALARSPSRASTATAPKSALTRKPSTLNKATSSRPSLGPPPSQLKKQPSRQSLPHSSALADDSFLARMMRPTTSSASKTADKAVTPPKAPTLKKTVPKEAPPKFEIPKKDAQELSKAGPSSHKEKEKESAPAKTSTKPKTAKNPPSETPAQPKEETKLLEPPPTLQQVIPDALESPVSNIEAGEGIEKAARICEETVDQAKATLAKVAVSKPEEKYVLKKAIENKPLIDDIKTDSEAETPTEPKDTVFASEPVVDEEEDETEPAAPQIVDEQAEIPKVSEPVLEDGEALSPVQDTQEPVIEAKDEPVIPETIPEVESESTSPTKEEDPEDIRARKEIAKMNAELMETSFSDPADAVDKTTLEE